MGDFESAFFDIIFEKPKKLRKGIRMRTIQLQVNDTIYDQISTSGMDIQARFDEFVAELIDDEYLRSIDGMVESIRDARNTLSEQGVSIDKLEW